MFYSPLAVLYYVSFLLLVGLAAFILVHRPRSRLGRIYALLTLCLLLWKATLFLEIRVASPDAQIWLGRANFAAVALGAYLALLFVQRVISKRRRVSVALLLQTLFLTALTMFTPLICESERVELGQAITTYGPLFGYYMTHVLGCLLAALLLACLEHHRSYDRVKRAQLQFIGIGLLLTGGVAAITNVYLPYYWGDFRFCDVGVLSTVLFAASIAYTTLVHNLFGIRVVLKITLVYGVLMALITAAYSSGVFVLSQFLTEEASRLEQFLVLFLAFSFDPLRRFLEGKVDAVFVASRAEAGDQKRESHGRKRPGALARLLSMRSLIA